MTKCARLLMVLLAASLMSSAQAKARKAPPPDPPEKQEVTAISLKRLRAPEAADALKDDFLEVKMLAAGEKMLLVLYRPENAASSADRSELGAALEKLDLFEYFESGHSVGNFIVRTKPLAAEDVQKAFDDPQGLLRLEKAGTNTIVLFPQDMTLPTKVGNGNQKALADSLKLDQEAARLKQDLTAIIKKVAPADKKKMDGEDWVEKHSIHLRSLNARDVAKALRRTWRGVQVKALGDKTLLVLSASDPRPQGKDVLADLKALEASEREESAKDTKEPAGAGADSGKAKPSPASKDKADPPATKDKKAKKAGGAKPASPNAGGAKPTPTPAGGAKPPPTSTPATGAGQASETTKGDGSDAAATPKKDAGVGKGPGPLQDALAVRLYYLRSASKIADALNNAAGGDTQVAQAIGEDQILLLNAGDNKEFTAENLYQYVALLDLPRPQITLQLWAYQMSSDNPELVDKTFTNVRGAVQTRNEILEESLRNGWMELLKDPPDSNGNQAQVSIHEKAKFNQDFVRYISDPFSECRQRDEYCLGYVDAFSKAKPSVSRMLLFLAASQDPNAAAERVVKAMEATAATADQEVATAAQQKSEPACSGGVGRVDDKDNNAGCFRFTHFRKALRNLLGEPNRSVFRAAILDFLFEYKLIILYRHDFVPYDLQRTTKVLDSQLAPVQEALNRDLEDYVKRIKDVDAAQWELQKETAKGWKKQKGLYTQGLIKVTAVSGTQAAVEGRVLNYFDITTPPSLSELLKSNDVFSKGLPDVLTAKEAMIAGIAANMLAQQRVVAEVARGMKLTITPTALDTASAAELNLDLEAGEDTAPSTVAGDSTKKDTIDRVTKHHVTDTIRVDTLKLFEVSTFLMDVRHPQEPFLVPGLGQVWKSVFGSIPRFGDLFSFPRGPYKRESESLIIVSALVVPTAMDLGLSMRIEGDRQVTADGTQRMKGLPGQVRPLHKLRIQCLVDPALEKDDACLSKNLKLHSVVPDKH